jgi:minor extracellular serine protease Vpr
VAADPVSVSFGSIPSGSGKDRTFRLTLTNLSNASETLTFSFDAVTGTGVAYSVGTSSLTLDAGESGAVTVIATVDKRASDGDHQAYLTISDNGTEVAHLAVYTSVS